MAMTGISATLSLGVPFMLHERFSVAPNLAVMAGLLTAFVVNFLVSKRFVFRSAGETGIQLLRFASVSFLFRAGEYLAFLLVHGAFGLQYMVALVAVLATSLLVKFFVYKLFVFARRDETLPAPGF